MKDYIVLETEDFKGECKMRFPKILDNASVLCYTPENSYGEVYYTTGKLAEHIRYLAIC